MLRSVVVALDGFESGVRAFDVALEWARPSHAAIVALAIVDVEGWGAAVGAAKRPTSEGVSRFRESLAACATRCAELGLACQTIEGLGQPHARILIEAQEHDLVVLGARSRFAYGWQGDPGQTLALILRDSPRAVAAVPEAIREGAGTVVAYDGSIQAARALAAFEASGLGQDGPIHVVSVAAEHAEAMAHAQRAVDFLRLHGIEATVHAVDSRLPPADVILKYVERLGVGLLVMGAYGKAMVRDFFVGSVTRSLLARSPVPLFLFH
jgi:nucleotide-binding universal stress UspA family protein